MLVLPRWVEHAFGVAVQRPLDTDAHKLDWPTRSADGYRSEEVRPRITPRPCRARLPADFGKCDCPSSRVCQSQRLGSGISRAFFEASARSIAFSASTIAVDLLCALPVITTFATDADHLHKFRPMP
jgi:hypothetical protein